MRGTIQIYKRNCFLKLSYVFKIIFKKRYKNSIIESYKNHEWCFPRILLFVAKKSPRKSTFIFLA